MRKIMLICVIGFFTVNPAWAGQPSSFDRVLEHYEAIRLSLLTDSNEGVAKRGSAIAAELSDLQADLSQARVGASAEVTAVVKELLPGMLKAADSLAKADSLEVSRAAFYELSKPLVRWREGLNEENRPSVAYCPMHKKSWLQPGSKIGNPYGGMPGCGQIVSE